MDLWAIAAGALSVVTGFLHVFWGGRDVARPLLESDLDFDPKITAYYGWHMATIVIFGMAAAFFYAGLVADGRLLAAAATALAAAFAVLSVGLVVWKRCAPLVLPQWAFFGAIAALGVPASV